MTYNSKSNKDQPGKVASPARGQLNRENEYSPVRVRSCLRIWSRETGSAVPSRVSLLISVLRRNLVLTYGIPPELCRGIHLFIVVFIYYVFYLLPIIETDPPSGKQQKTNDLPTRFPFIFPLLPPHVKQK